MDKFLPLSRLHAQVTVELVTAPPAGESRPNQNFKELTESLTATLIWTAEAIEEQWLYFEVVQERRIVLSQVTMNSCSFHMM